MPGRRVAPGRVWAVSETIHADTSAEPVQQRRARRSLTLGPVVIRRPLLPGTVLAVASLGVFMAFVDATIVTIAFPDMQRSFPDSEAAGLSWVLNAYNIVFAAFLVAAGRAADLLGRKKVFEIGLVVFTGASALCAAAPTVEVLIAARVLQAAGAAILVPSSLGLVVQAFPEERTRGVALWAATAALAAGLGPSVGGVLVEVSSWRAAFLINLPIGAVALVLARRRLVESRAPGRRALPDLPGAVVFAVAVAALALGIVKGEDWGWSSGGVIACFALAVGLGWGFVRRSRRHPSPLVDGALIRIRSVAVANTLMLVAAASYFALILNNVLFLTGVWGWSILDAGLAMTPGPIIAAVVAAKIGRGAETRPRLLICLGAATWALGAAGYLLLCDSDPSFLTKWLPATILAGVGAGLAFPTLSGAAVAAAPGGRFATATALNSVARQLGAALGVAALVAIVGAATDALEGARRGWLFSIGVFGLVALAAPLLGRPPPAPEADDDDALPPVGGQARSMVAVTTNGARPAAVTPTSTVLDPSAPLDRFLAAVPLLADAPPQARERLAAEATLVRLRGGEWLFHEGDPGDSLFVLGAGRLEVVKEGGFDEEVIRVVRPGEVLGELAILTRSPRSASVRARRDAVLVRVDGDTFEVLLREEPELGLRVTRELARQVQASRPAGAAPAAPVKTLAVVGLEDGLPLAELCRALAAQLGRFGTVAHSGPVAGRSEADQAMFLERLERDHDRVLLEAGTPKDGGPWSALCLRQADRVLALTRGGPVPDWLFWHPGLRGCELVYLDDAAEARPIAEWSRVLRPRARHRVAPGEDWEPTVAAMARRLCGRSIGIVLSGGGARGFAHLGVLAELERAGVQIDRVGGVSCGSWIGAMFALGMDAEEMVARCYEEWVRRNPLGDYTVPRQSVIRGHRVRAVFERNLPGLIEQLPRDYFCVSCDLVSGELVVHRDGVLAVAAAASQCLPGLAPPLVQDGRLLVDGGIRNNLPVDVMAAAGEGPVIAVDVTSRYTPPVRAARTRRRAREQGLWDDESPRPTLFETISRAVVLGSVDTVAAAERHADLVIRPANDDIGMLEWHQLDRAQENGRRAARAALAEAPGWLT